MSLLALALALLAAAAPARAVIAQPLDTPPVSQDQDDACRPERLKLCSDASDVPGCLQTHVNELSAACRAAHPNWGAPPTRVMTSGRSARAGSGQEGCAADAQRLCTPAENQPGRRPECLSRHWFELSRACAENHPEWEQDALRRSPPPAPEWTGEKGAWHGACPPPSDGDCLQRFEHPLAFWKCLEDRWEDLPAACRDFAAAHNPWKERCGAQYATPCGKRPANLSSACMQKQAAKLTGACATFARSLEKSLPPRPPQEAGKARAAQGKAPRPPAAKPSAKPAGKKTAPRPATAPPGGR